MKNVFQNTQSKACVNKMQIIWTWKEPFEQKRTKSEFCSIFSFRSLKWKISANMFLQANWYSGYQKQSSNGKIVKFINFWLNIFNIKNKTKFNFWEVAVCHFKSHSNYYWNFSYTEKSPYKKFGEFCFFFLFEASSATHMAIRWFRHKNYHISFFWLPPQSMYQKKIKEKCE